MRTPADPVTDHHAQQVAPAFDLRHHGDAELAPGLVDLAVNVRSDTPPRWLASLLAGTAYELAAYPDRARAITAVARRHGRGEDEVLLTAGAAEAFVLLARALQPSHAVVVHPQFTEPEAALRAAGHEVERVVLSPDFVLDPRLVPTGADLVYIGNPTNPTSVLHRAEAIAALARSGRVLVVDEAFADCVPGEPESLAHRSDLPGLVVIRSLTKTWGLAGLRAGYLLAEPQLLAGLAPAQPLWAVSTPALVAIEACSAPPAVAEAQIWARTLASDRGFLVDGLTELGIHVVPRPAASFVCARVPDAQTVRAQLRARGYAVRRGETFPGLGPQWLRIAVRDRATVRDFLGVLGEILDRRSDRQKGEEAADVLEETLAAIRPPDAAAMELARTQQSRLTKPRGSLGVLEDLAVQLAGLAGACPPPMPEPAAVTVFAGDHGVHARGVSPWPQEVTAQMVANFLAGGAVVNCFAARMGAAVTVVDVGVASDLEPAAGLLDRKVAYGTADMTRDAAMTREQALRAVEVGIQVAWDLVTAGHRCLITGDMGIANTTPAAALISCFTGREAAEVTGRGTGVDDATYHRKIEVVRTALGKHRPDPGDPLSALAAVGGLEHAALAGFILGAAARGVPVILDGMIASAAALVAAGLHRGVVEACIAGHRSAEPGHTAVLEHLALRPLVDLELRLGEGTGALLALPLVQSAVAVLHEVATFDSAGVTEKQ